MAGIPLVYASVSTVALIVANVPASPIELRTVALSGDQAPGTPPGVTFSFFGNSDLSEVGGATFRAGIEGPDVDDSNDVGFWSEWEGSIELVVRNGDLAPGTPQGVVFSELIGPIANDAGAIAFRALLDGSDVDDDNNSGIWAERGGSFALVAREGDRAPGTPAGVFFSALNNGPVFNDRGQTAFQGVLTGAGVNGSNNRGFWSEGGGSLALVARKGDAAVGMPDGVIYSSLVPPIRLNRSGQSAFLGNLSGPGVDPSNDEGIWIGGPGSLSLFLRKGDRAPGTPPGVFFSELPRPKFDDDGIVTIQAVLAGATIDATNDEGFWSGDGDSLTLLVWEGQSAPGTPPGVVFRGLLGPARNGIGQIAFGGGLSGPGVDNSNDGGIWTNAGGPLSLLAREGDRAPGTPPGVVFLSLGAPFLNDEGQIAFRAPLTGPGVDDTNFNGIWFADANGHLRLVVRRGDRIDVNNDPQIDDLRTISALIFNVADFGASNQLAFKALFTDESQGIFIATVRCPADIDGDGDLDAHDFFVFLDAFAGVELEVCDVDADGDCDAEDFFGYLDLFSRGCEG